MLTILIGIGIPTGILYFWYVAIITRRNALQEAYSGIDVQLKKRADLVPNILKIASKFMDHEKSLLTEITELRTAVLTAQAASGNSVSADDVEQRFQIESKLQDKLSQLMLSVENYPDLKSQQNMIEAQRVFADVEEHISAARRSFNAANTALRNSIQVPPGNLLANWMGIAPLPFFEIANSERAPIDAGDFLK